MEPRKFTAFKEAKLKAGDILRITCLLADECPVSKISSTCLLSKAAVQKVVTIARCAILKHVNDSQPVVRDGNGSIVEIDETLIAKRKYNRGRLVQQQWLFGAVDRSIGICLLNTVQKRDAATLGALISEFIAEQTTVYSDKWAVYVSFFSSGVNYSHETVNHSENFLNPQNPQIHTQTIEGLWSHLKRFFRSKNLTNRDYLEHYVAEFEFRRNNKDLNNIDLAIKVVELINEF